MGAAENCCLSRRMSTACYEIESHPSARSQPVEHSHDTRSSSSASRSLRAAASPSRTSAKSDRDDEARRAISISSKAGQAHRRAGRA